MAHQESCDPKPLAPIEYRGELGTIKTKLEGVVFNELLKNTAQIADKITVCRSMTHGEAAHERGTHNMFTGYRPSPALQFPSLGSVVSHEFGPRNNLPPYVCVPSQPTTYAGPGYLSSAFAPFSLGSDPANGGFRVQDLTLPGGVDDKPLHHPPHHARRRQRPLRRARKRPTAWRRWTRSTSGPTALSARRRPARRSTSTPSAGPCATSTAATPPASGC